MTSVAVKNELNPLTLAALALLVERPMHPYEMYQLLMARSEDRLLKIRPGTLYHAVGRLAAADLVEATGTERDGNRPERTSYRITDSGRRRLTSSLQTMLSTPVPEYPQFPLALAEAHNLAADVVADLLTDRIGLLTTELAVFDAGIDSARSRGVPLQYWVDATYQCALRRTELDWLIGFVDQLRAGDIPWDAPAPPTHHHVPDHRESSGPAS